LVIPFHDGSSDAGVRGSLAVFPPLVKHRLSSVLLKSFDGTRRVSKIGAHPFFQKPFSFEELTVGLQSAVEAAFSK
jgi:hypothetical protein